jgi:PAS domain S-box-containing protein
MGIKEKSKQELLLEIEELRKQLYEAKTTSHAFKHADVDTLVTSAPKDEYVYSLKGADQPYRILVEAMDEGALILAQDGTIFYCNSSFAEMLKRPVMEIIGSAIWEHVVAGEEERAKWFLRQTEKPSAKAEMNFRVKDGTYVPLHLSISSLRMHDIRGFCVVASDLSVGKRQEERIRFQASLLDQVRNAVIATDLKGNIVYWNNYATTLYQWKIEEIIGRYVVDLIVPESDRNSVVDIFAGLTGDVYWQGELRLQRKDGTTFPADIYVVSILKIDGSVIGFVAVTVDITERKRIEEQLLTNSKHLEEVNAALRILLRHRDEEKVALQQDILSNVKSLILPYLGKLKQSRLDNDQMTYLGILETHLLEIVSPFTKNLSQEFFKLSSMEVQVADLVKAGKTNKEIAAILGLAKNTILVHRHRIRTKLGLRNNKTNLKSYLKSLA